MKKLKIIDKFSYDYYRMTGETYNFSVKTLFNMVMRHNIRYMFLWRLHEKFPNIWLRYRLYKYAKKYGLEVSGHAQIDQGLYLGHPYNITVAEGTKIGKNVNLHKGCTIGRECRGSREGVPSIGNNVFVGINATIVGNITIGDDVLIAANSFVNFDVPSHSVVIGNPAFVIKKECATERYINFIT